MKKFDIGQKVYYVNLVEWDEENCEPVREVSIHKVSIISLPLEQYNNQRQAIRTGWGKQDIVIISQLRATFEQAKAYAIKSEKAYYEFEKKRVEKIKHRIDKLKNLKDTSIKRKTGKKK